MYDVLPFFLDGKNNDRAAKFNGISGLTVAIQTNITEILLILLRPEPSVDLFGSFFKSRQQFFPLYVFMSIYIFIYINTHFNTAQ